MNGWYALIPAIAGCLGALAAWLKGHANTQRLNDHLGKPGVDVPPTKMIQ